MTTLLSLHPSPLPSPKPTSPRLPPSSFSHLAPPSPDGPSRPLPTHQSIAHLRRSSPTSSTPPPSKSLLLSSSPSYGQSAAPTASPSASSFADRGRSPNTGMLGVAWGSRRESEGQLEQVDQDGLRGESSSSRTGGEGDLSLGSGEGSRQSSPLLPSPRLVEEDDSFEDEGELRRPSKAWILGQRGGSCDSSGTESSNMTTGSSASSHSSASTSTSSSTLASTASSLATPPVVYEDLAVPTMLSSSVEVHEEEILVKIKKDKKGYGFGVLKGWLGSVKKDKGKERANVVAPLPLASSSASASSFAGGVGKLAPPLILQDSSRPSNRLAEAVISSGNRDAENDTDEDEEDASRDEDETSETDDSTAADSSSSSTSTLRLHLSPSLGTVPLPSDSLPVPLPPPTRLSQLLSPLQTFPFPSSFRRSSPPPPTSPILPASPTTPTGPPARQSAGPTPPTLTPLQSLHLLSSQKLFLLVRPPPPAHPIFVAPEKKGSERRFPGSTNRLGGGVGGKKSRVRGLEVELGVRGLMRRLEKGGKASGDEVEGLVRLFRTRPVSLIRDSHGNFVASIGPSSSDLALDSPPSANISSSALQAAAPAAGSGILAFIARPTFEERVDVYLHDAASDGFITANVVTARGLGVMELEFSVGMDALAEEILSRAKGGGSPMGRKSSLGLSLAVPGWRPTSIVDGGDAIPTGGRRSPTDGKRTIIEEEVVVEGPPRLADVTLTPVEASSNVVLPPSSSSNSTTPTPIPSRLPASPFSSSSNESSPTTPTQHPNLLSTPSPPPPHSDGQRVVSTSDPTPPPPRTRRFSSLSRQSFPPPTSSPIPESALDDEEDEDELPLAVLKQRSSFLRSARTSPTLPSDEPLPPPPPLPQPKQLVSAMRSASKDRVLRFSPDTLDHEQRERARREAEVKEREVRETEEEKERIRVEEEDRKRQERYRQEVAASRLRRESAKLGTVKGNHGNWEDLSSGGSGGSTPSGGSSESATGAPPRKQAKRSESSGTLREENVRSSAVSTSSSSNRRSVSTADLGTPRGSYHDRHSASYHERPPSLVSTTATSTPQSASPRSSVSSISRIDPRPHIAGLPPKRPSFSSFQDSGLTPSTSPALSSGSSSKFSSYSHQQQQHSSPHHSRHQPRSSLYSPQTSTPPPPQMIPTSFTSPHSLAMLAAGGGAAGAYPMPMPQQVLPYGYPQPYTSFVPAHQQNFGGYNPYFPNGFVPQQQQQQFYAPPPLLQHQPQYHQHQGGHPSVASATRESSGRSSYAGGSVKGRR